MEIKLTSLTTSISCGNYLSIKTIGREWKSRTLLNQYYNFKLLSGSNRGKIKIIARAGHSE